MWKLKICFPLLCEFQWTREWERSGSKKQCSSNLWGNEQRRLFLKSGILLYILLPFGSSLKREQIYIYICACDDACFVSWVTFSLASHCLKWAGKPCTLSPLMCARYGWINIGCDMLKCSSCQVFLCAALQPTLDFNKCEPKLNLKTRTHTLFWQVLPKKKGRVTFLLLFLKDASRIAEISRQLQTQHEKFCPWPDIPCPGRSKNFVLHVCTNELCPVIEAEFAPRVLHVMLMGSVAVISERFWLVPAYEPSALLTAFLERFKSACLLAKQLPAMKPEQLNSMVRLEKGFRLFMDTVKNALRTIMTVFFFSEIVLIRRLWKGQSNYLSKNFMYSTWKHNIFSCSHAH